jgi:hypothetical protein
MNPFLLWGMLGGALLVAVYTTVAVYLKKSPNLAHSMEIAISSIGASGGVKMIYFVLIGDKFSVLLKIPEAGLVEDDAIYFFLGSLALLWASLNSICSRLAALKDN